MAYQALYRKWRPLSFNDVVGQSHIVQTLKNEISEGKTAHAYLFCGTRGTGKTSCAKIFARAINCLHPKDGNPCNECEICKGALDGSILDIVEIDAASNNGVDNIREIRDEVSYSAAQAKYKIYIIDEVHMLSSGAFNALLKTLEEPPEHVVFILATTEAHKLPATITSRCQRFDFHRISVRDIENRLRLITAEEGIAADAESISLIAKAADGAMRDALSILDQCAGACGKDLTAEKVRDTLSIASDDAINDTVEAIYESDSARLLGVIEKIVQSGRDINNYAETVLKRFRDIMVYRAVRSEKSFEYSNSAENIESIKRAAEKFSGEQIAYIADTLCSAMADAKWQKNPRTLYEIAFLRLADSRLSDSNKAIVARIEKIEAALGKGAYIPAQAPKEETEIIKKAGTEETAPSDDSPPWDEDEPVCEDQIQPAADKEIKAEPVSEKPHTAKDTESADGLNVWNEVLKVLSKSNPPMYGALMMKKAKFSGGILYLVNEAYVKAIIDSSEAAFMEALNSVCPTAKVSFASQSEFDMKEDEPYAGKTPAKETQTPLPADEADPLDALFNMGNSDIVEE